MPESKPGFTTPSTLWFSLAMASRWPLALATWAIALAAIQILKQPIPIALPLDQPLPVRVVGDLRMDALREPLKIKGAESLQIEAAATLPVQGSVGVKGDVGIQGDVDVAGDVSVEEVQAPVSVQGENGEPVVVSTSEEKPLEVTGSVGVNQVGGKISVQIRDAAKSLLPIP